MNGQVQQHHQQPQMTPDEMAEMDRQKVTLLHFLDSFRGSAPTDFCFAFQVNQSLIKYIEEFKFPYISDVSNYEKLLKIGQGTFG